MLAEFGRSDVGGHPVAGWHVWLSNSGAHLALGGAVALSRVPRLALALAAFWAAKELTCDLPGDSYALTTWADSCADMVLGAAGFLAVRYRLNDNAGEGREQP